MSCSVITYETFDRAAKKLAKRYDSFKADLARLFARLERHPDDGTAGSLQVSAARGFRFYRFVKEDIFEHFCSAVD